MAKNENDRKYSYLDQLSTQQLEEILRADIESPDCGDDGIIFYILEMIEKREREHPTGRLTDIEKAWANFKKYYHTAEGEGLSLYPIEDHLIPKGSQFLSVQSGPAQPKPVAAPGTLFGVGQFRRQRSLPCSSLE